MVALFSLSSSTVSVPHIRTLFWYHLTSQLRRVIATYVIPTILILFNFIILYYYFENYKKVQINLDYDVYYTYRDKSTWRRRLYTDTSDGKWKIELNSLYVDSSLLEIDHDRCHLGSLLSNAFEILKDVGYCSQLEKLPTYLIARSVVEKFGKLRGLDQMEINRQIDYMVQLLEVQSHMSKLLGRCSGGTKRKIATMVAFIGYPKLIILDECTTGVDPLTRSKFSQLIRDAKLRGSTVVISSHTMEEVESIADTICIMKDGKSFCEDTSDNLKLHYGRFYSVAIKVYDRTSDAPIEFFPEKNNPVFLPNVEVESQPGTSRQSTANPCISNDHVTPPHRKIVTETIFTEMFPGAELQYTFSAGLHRHMFYNVLKESITLSALFSKLESLKNDYSLEDCVINTASLEHIFMQICLEDEYTL